MVKIYLNKKADKGGIMTMKKDLNSMFGANSVQILAKVDLDKKVIEIPDKIDITTKNILIKFIPRWEKFIERVEGLN